MRNVLALACWLALVAVLAGRWRHLPLIRVLGICTAPLVGAGVAIQFTLSPLNITPILPFSAASRTKGPEVSADAGLGGMAMFAIAATANAKTKASPQEGVCH